MGGLCLVESVAHFLDVAQEPLSFEQKLAPLGDGRIAALAPASKEAIKRSVARRVEVVTGTTFFPAI